MLEALVTVIIELPLLLKFLVIDPLSSSHPDVPDRHMLYLEAARLEKPSCKIQSDSGAVASASAKR